MSDPEIATAKNQLGGLFRRPLSHYDARKDETITVIPSPYELLYIGKCVNCKFIVSGPLAKCTIERCHNVTVEFQDRILSGIMEIMFSKRITVSIPKGEKLPTITVDNTSKCHLHLHDPTSIHIIHSVWVEDVVVHMDPPHMTEQKLEHPVGEEGEFITRCSVGRLFTEKAIREGGGYLTTVREKEAADKKDAEFERRMTEFVSKMIHTSKPGNKIPEQTKPVEKKEKKPVTTDKKVNEEKESVRFDAGELSDQLQKGKEKLKPTETVERQHPVVGTGGGRGGPGYNIKDDEEKKEFFDNEEMLTKKVKKTVEWIKSSKHVIFFTGAGISTSAGIPDFRSGMDTVLPTGPGVWELQEKGVPHLNPKVTPILRAIPTSTHMAVVKLHEAGLSKFTVSQNVDGLHRRSGIPPAELSELHGNTNLETCKKCGRQYLRDFETREAFHVFNHNTSRKCDNPSCQGQLQDSIINFGENLPEGELHKAFDNAQKADLCIVLGSSLRVRPACQVPEVVLANGGKVIICNLQKIPQFPSSSRSMQIYSMCDVYMKRVLHELQMDIPKFLLYRRLKITSENTKDDLKLVVTGVDVEEDIPYSFIQSATVEGKREIKEPFTFSLPTSTKSTDINLSFHGHYREPPLTLTYNPDDGVCFYWMTYDISTGEWHHMCKKGQ